MRRRPAAERRSSPKGILTASPLAQLRGSRTAAYAPVGALAARSWLVLGVSSASRDDAGGPEQRAPFPARAGGLDADDGRERGRRGARRDPLLVDARARRGGDDRKARVVLDRAGPGEVSPVLPRPSGDVPQVGAGGHPAEDELAVVAVRMDCWTSAPYRARSCARLCAAHRVTMPRPPPSETSAGSDSRGAMLGTSSRARSNRGSSRPSSDAAASSAARCAMESTRPTIIGAATAW